MRTAKRALDICVGLFGLVAVSPLLAVVAVAVDRAIGRPVLFRQVRPGLNGVPFTLVKFRTMSEASQEVIGSDPSDAGRIHPLGVVLRRYSLDELPELWNVIRGDMSLVGPRPLLLEYLPLYTAEQARRHAVKPGMTGLAQVLGRNEVSWDRRLDLDIWYIDHWTFWLDLRIIAMTVSSVISGRGVSAKGHATMPRFEGSGRV